MNFIFITIAALLGFWLGIIYSRTESRLSENKLLDEVRKLCNELLKKKGHIEITNLSLSKSRGPSRVTVTTMPRGESKYERKWKQLENIRDKLLFDRNQLVW